MASPRKSATQVAAREKARAKAQELTARHEKLIDLAADFFERQEQAEQVRADARVKADALLARAEEEAVAATAGAAGTVAAMVASGESKSAVAARLGITGAELKKLLDQAGAAARPAAAERPAAVAGNEETAEAKGA
ncbi:hypothetical protein ACRB8A_19620 (plasmid) [Arthrobacter sp. G.S.26]|uniref:hypothetical protein n=1 Tax=Arthrobacter sp. G.S.26 TaxID=3433706 RepID=UPI003D776BB8